MIETLAGIVVVMTGLYFLGLGTAALAYPQAAKRFLRGHASSPRLHYLELAVRLWVGASLVVIAPRLAFSGLLLAAGWLLVVTSTGLALVPWRWHRRFAERAVPQVLPFLAWIGVASLVLGSALLILAVPAIFR